MTAQLNLEKGLDSKVLNGISKMTSLGAFIKKTDSLRGKDIIFATDSKARVPINGWGKESLQDNFFLNPIIPVTRPTIITGIDSSCVKIAETDEGIVYAIKCGVVFCTSHEAVLHFRVGPLLLYLSEESLSGLDIDARVAKVILFDSEAAKRMIRINAERLIQFELSKILNDAIILVDGSLKNSVFENRHYDLSKIIENCVFKNNTLIGIGKTTRFRVLDKISGNLRGFKGPGVVDVSLIIQSLVRSTRGLNTMVKFSEYGLILRADVIETNLRNVVNSLGKIIGNDSTPLGYPECLSMAHHISVFSNSELSCVKGHILKNYHVIELPSHDVRRNLLGSI